MTVEELGSVIKERRQILGIDQRNVAELAEISTHTLSNIETGRANPTFAVLTRVLDLVGLELVVRVRAPNG